MVHHVSISALDPHHVAEVLAELMSGRCYPFPGPIPDSFMAVSGDEHGTMVEVAPRDMVSAYTGLFQLLVLDAQLTPFTAA